MTLIAEGLKELERDMRKAATVVSRAEARGLKRVGVTVAARQARAVVQTVNLKISTVKAAVRTKRQPSADRLEIVFEVTAKAISLVEFDARGSWKGASVKVLRASGRKKVRGGFLTPTPQGARQIWKRTGQPKRLMTKGRYAGKRREPIKNLFGPSILSQYLKESIQTIGRDTFYERCAIEIDREVAFALSKLRL